MHQLEGVADIVQRQGMSDKLVNFQLFLQVLVDQFGHTVATLEASKGCALPSSSRHQLEWPRTDLFAGRGHTYNGRDAPTFVTRFQRGTLQPTNIRKSSDRRFE